MPDSDTATSYLSHLAALVVFLLVVGVASLGIRWLFARVANRLQSSLLTAFSRPAVAFLWWCAIVSVGTQLLEWLGHDPFLWSGKIWLHIGALLAVAWGFLRWQKSLLKTLAGHQDRQTIDIIDKSSSLLIYVLTTIALLSQAGVHLGALLAFGGISGLAVAFAAQQVIANFFSGLMLYVTKPFSIGDWIQIPEKEVDGYVEQIGWYTTRVRALDQHPLYIPNALFSNALVINPSRIRLRQFKETLSVRYQDFSLLPHLLEKLRTLFAQHPRIDKGQQTRIHLATFGTIGIDIQITAYTPCVDKYAYSLLHEELLFAIGSTILEAGADFAIPTTGIEFPKGIPQR